MGELEGVLSLEVKKEMLSWAPESSSKVNASAVAAKQAELGYDAWMDREYHVREIAEDGALTLHAGRRLEKVRSMYRAAARSYCELMQAIDFKVRVEHLMYVIGEDDDLEAEAKRWDGVKRGRDGRMYGVQLEKLDPDPYQAECALACAMIAQDWECAELLAANIPIPKSTTARETMTLSLLRFVVLQSKKQVKDRLKVYSTQSSGIDLSPRRGDFALAIVERDSSLLSKALKGTIQSFRNRWKLEKYATPAAIKRCGSREAAMDTAARRLFGLRWAYSSWAVAMICLAAHVGMETPDNPKSYSDFVPYDLCRPAKS